MTTLYITLGGVAVIALALWLAIRAARKEGSAANRAEQSEQVVKNVETANEARDSVKRDSPDARRKRVREWSRG